MPLDLNLEFGQRSHKITMQLFQDVDAQTHSELMDFAKLENTVVCLPSALVRDVLIPTHP